MASFHVFVEGPTDRSPDGVQRLAEAIASAYGLPAADLAKRMGAGRFRVKANINRATADTYVRALEGLGARVTLEEARPTQPVPIAPAGSAAPATRPSTSALPPASPGTGNAARPSSSSLPPALPRTMTPQPFVSGLSAAFTDEAPAADLGALGDGSLALSSLDGNEDNSPQGGSFNPPGAGLPASIGPATAPPAPAAAKAEPTTDAPLDLFAPPDAAEAEVEMALAPEEIEHRARKLNTPPAGVAIAQPATGSDATSRPMTPAARRSAPVPIEEGQGGVRAAARETPRARFAAGVVLSILLGFVPAHLIASMREESAFATIDAQVHAAQLQADTPEMYRQLDAFRAAQLSRKESEQRSIAMVSMLIWALAGAGLAYVWFRQIPWERLGGNKPA